MTCIDPAAAGTAATWHEGVTSTYTVECEQQSGVSSLAAYPSSVVVASDTLPVDSTPALATCTTGTSGSGTTEEYIKECVFSATPTAADAGGYAATFTATGDGGVGTTTSGALNITVNAATLSCIDPAAAGSSATFDSSAGGTVNAYTVECEEQSGISGVSAYPTSIAIDPSSVLPTDATFSAAYNGTGTLPSTCTHATSGSGTTEFYILECDLNETAVSADNGSYTGVFDAVGAGGTPALTSGTLALTVTGPSDVCTAPASGGTATTFHVTIASTYSVACYGTGFSSANAGNYPASITLNTGTLPVDATEATSTSSTPACTQSTSGSGLTEEYILTCAIKETPTAADVGTYPLTFTATPGAAGGSTVTTGTLTLTVAGINPTCIDPAAGGTATSFYENSANSYTVECEAQSGVSGTTAYPTQIAVATGSLPADGNPTFATSTSSSPACTTGTSGSGTTEEYILECALADTPTSGDGGSYPLTFTATGPGGAGTVTSGTLTVTITPPTTTCSTPASGGTSVSWVDGTAENRDHHLLQPRLRHGQRRQLPLGHHPQLGHPALRCVGGHLDGELAGVHHGDIGHRPGRGVRARVQGHRDTGLRRQRHLPCDLPGRWRGQRGAQRGVGDPDRHHLPARSELGDRRLERRELLLGHQGGAVLLHHRRHHQHRRRRHHRESRVPAPDQPHGRRPRRPTCRTTRSRTSTWPPAPPRSAAPTTTPRPAHR